MQFQLTFVQLCNLYIFFLSCFSIKIITKTFALKDWKTFLLLLSASIVLYCIFSWKKLEQFTLEQPPELSTIYDHRFWTSSRTYCWLLDYPFSFSFKYPVFRLKFINTGSLNTYSLGKYKLFYLKTSVQELYS